jgi:hypothetical protein
MLRAIPINEAPPVQDAGITSIAPKSHTMEKNTTSESISCTQIKSKHKMMPQHLFEVRGPCYSPAFPTLMHYFSARSHERIQRGISIKTSETYDAVHQRTKYYLHHLLFQLCISEKEVAAGKLFTIWSRSYLVKFALLTHAVWRSYQPRWHATHQC